MGTISRAHITYHTVSHSHVRVSALRDVQQRRIDADGLCNNSRAQWPRIEYPGRNANARGICTEQ
jgi:hypothetical protein